MERVLVSEHITSGAWADRPLEGSLAIEGRAMLVALARDLSVDPGVEIVTTWDARLGPFPVETVEVEVVESVAAADEAFRRLAGDSDRTLVIAPEVDGLLEQRSEQVDAAGGRWIGCRRSAIAICSDKLATAAHLQQHGIAVVDTRTADQPRPDSDFVVWKPRDGAGSMEIRVRPADQSPPHPDHVVQPLLDGRPVSVAVLISDSGITCLPVAEQFVDTDGDFAYHGGLVPCLPSQSPSSRDVTRLAAEACGCIEGLEGWVGVDLLLDSQQVPIVLEVNPRLTTSFLGYRRLARFPLGRLAVFPEESPANFLPGDWHGEVIEFTSDGTPATCLR